MERELKCIFGREDTATIIEIVSKVLEKKFWEGQERTKGKPQRDVYYDTLDLEYAKKEVSVRIRQKGDKLEGTYKAPTKSGTKVLFDRDEVPFAVEENSAEALIEGAKKEGITLSPDIIPLLGIINFRKKQNFIKSVESVDGTKLELAIDDELTFENLRTGESIQSTQGEFELEYKTDVSIEQAEKEIGEIWLSILRECAQRNILITRSKDSKSIRGLKEIGLLGGKEKEEDIIK